MNRIACYLLISLVTCTLFLGCGPATDSGTNGQSTRDSVTTPGPGDNTGGRAWAADQNLFDPNLLDDISDPLDQYMLPFSGPFLKQRQITNVEVRTYSAADNADLTDSSAEKDLQVSRKRAFAFTANGQIEDLLDEQFMGDVTPDLSMHAHWTYLPTGMPSKIDFEEKMGSKKSSHQRTFTTNSQGQMRSSEDKASLSAYFDYDPKTGHVYMLRRTVANISEVYVIGKAGDFPDSTCFRIQDEVLMRESKFVDYAQTGGKLMDVIFLERKDRSIVREVHMGKNGEINHVIEREYDTAGNITTRKYRWDVQNADFKNLTQYHYSPTGDLIEVFHQKQSFNRPVVNEIVRYTYGKDGLLQKRVTTTRTAQDPEELISVEFVTVKQSTAEGSVPSGAR